MRWNEFMNILQIKICIIRSLLVSKILSCFTLFSSLNYTNIFSVYVTPKPIKFYWHITVTNDKFNGILSATLMKIMTLYTLTDLVSHKKEIIKLYRSSGKKLID